MDIVFRCPNCLKALRVKAERGGKRVKCPLCHRPMTIPTPKQPGASADGLAGDGKGRGLSQTPAPGTREAAAACEACIDQKCLREFESDIQLTGEEKVIFFQKAKTVAPLEAGLSGRVPPALHLLVTTKQVAVMAKDREGNLYQERKPYARVRAVNVKPGTFYHTVDVVLIGDQDLLFKLDFPPSVKLADLERMADHVRGARGRID